MKRKTEDRKWIVNATCRNPKCKAKDAELEIEGKESRGLYYPRYETNNLVCMHCGMPLVQTSTWRKVEVERDETPDEELARLKQETDEASERLIKFLKSGKAEKSLVKRLLKSLDGEE